MEKPNGQIRVCLDPKDLNRAIKRQHHPMPIVDEILSKRSLFQVRCIQWLLANQS